jgi:hypothetical protein
VSDRFWSAQSRLNTITATARNLRDTIAVLIAVPGAAAALWIWLRPRPILGYILSAIIGACIGLLGALLIVLARRRRKTLTSGYRIISREVHYSFADDDPHKHQTRRIWLIKAVYAEVHLFYSDYRWTGSGSRTVTVESPGHFALGPPLFVGNFYRQYIAFGQPLMRGQETTVIVCEDLYDEAGTFEPFLFMNVWEPLKELTLRVTFSGNYMPPGEVRGTVMRNRNGRWESKRTEKLLVDNDTHSVTWALPNPQLRNHPKSRHQYRITWNRRADY